MKITENVFSGNHVLMRRVRLELAEPRNGESDVWSCPKHCVHEGSEDALVAVPERGFAKRRIVLVLDE